MMIFGLVVLLFLQPACSAKAPLVAECTSEQHKDAWLSDDTKTSLFAVWWIGTVFIGFHSLCESSLVLLPMYDRPAHTQLSFFERFRALHPDDKHFFTTRFLTGMLCLGVTMGPLLLLAERVEPSERSVC